jgi:YebC/PmpR family DNA-binding regulatory protein
MSGHSKWATIKHKKASADAQRGKVFTRIIKEITVAARGGGGDVDGNPRLRTAIDAAKAANMPKGNIENAIKKGTGELPGVVYEEITYEGYAPGGVALMIDVFTDNKNRTVAEIRHILDKHAGNLGETGCVGWMFNRVGMIRIAKENADEDAVMEKALEAGANDVQDGDDTWDVLTTQGNLEAVREALKKAGIKIESAERTAIPQTTVNLGQRDAEKVMKIMDKLEDHDDIQNVYANFEIADDVLEAIQA